MDGTDSHSPKMLVDYGSDSGGSDNEDDAPQQQHQQKPVAPATPAAAAPAAAAPKKAAVVKPPPKPAAPAPAPRPPAAFSSASIASGLALPPPKAAHGVKKRSAFKLDLPSLDSSSSTTDDTAESAAPQPAMKKARTTAPSDKPAEGFSASGLFAMLPAPKQAAPVLKKPTPAPIKVTPLEIGLDGKLEEPLEEPPEDEGMGGVLDFTPRGAAAAASAKGKEKETEVKVVRPLSLKPATGSSSTGSAAAAPAKKVKKDFFGLGTASSTSTPSPAISIPSTSSSTIISSAPILPTFVPPEPQSTDLYPGYYQHPTTQKWEAYDPVYYNSFWAARAKEEEEAQRAGGAHGREWDGLLNGTAEVGEVDMREAQKKAKEEMERKAMFAPAKPEYEAPAPKKAGGKAGSKNQMSHLIQNAQANRAALEEQIARAKANKRNAGTAYGF